METLNDLKALFQHEIQDLMSAEEQIIEALPQMIEKAGNEQLKNALQQHLEVTQRQRERLDKVNELIKGQEETEENKGFFSGLFGALQGQQKCKGMEGIITEGQKIMSADISPQVMDAAIIASAQKVEHYEICGYGTVRAYAEQLNLGEAERLLQQTLDEEYEADDLLTRLALGDVNERAERARGGKGNKSRSQGKDRGGNTKKALAKKVAVKKAANNSPKKAASSGNNSGGKKAASRNTAAPKKAAASKKAAAKKAAASKKAAAPKKAAAKKAATKKAATKKAAAKRGR